MRIAVTGGLGFIGQRIVHDLIDLGHEVVIVDFWERLVTKYEQERHPIVGSVYATISKAADLVEPWTFLDDPRLCGAQVVVHAGAVVDTTDLGDGPLWQLNVRYVQDLANRASESGAHIVFISSGATYGTLGHPNNPYGLSKVIGERIVRSVKTRSSSLRLFNVFGEHEHHKGHMASVPFKLAQAYRKGEIFRMFAPDAKRDFVPVSSVVDAVRHEISELMGPMKEQHRVRDVGTGIATSFADLDNYVMQACGQNASCTRIVEVPQELVGRYQGYTCAGMNGEIRAAGQKTTREGIHDYYGH